MPGLAHFCEHLLFMVRVDPFTLFLFALCLSIRAPSSTRKRTSTRRSVVKAHVSIALLTAICCCSSLLKIMAHPMPTLQPRIPTITSAWPRLLFVLPFLGLLLFSTHRCFHPLAHLVNSTRSTQNTKRTIRMICGAHSK